MKSALILINHMSNFYGSEMVALEVAEALKKMDFKVTIHANVLSDPVAEILKKHKIKASDSESFPDVFGFDFVWASHYLLPLAISQHKIPKKYKTRFYSTHLSPYEPLELVDITIANALGATFLANSAETASKLCELGVSLNRIEIFFNAAPNSFWRRASLDQNITLSKLLLVSNHPPKEVLSALDILRDRGLSISYIGIGGVHKRVLPLDIQAADAIISTGKTVQYSILSGVPVYCYDHFGGPGWLSENNFALCEKLNFSGRGFLGSEKAAQQIAEEIISLYGDAFIFTKGKRVEVRTKYSLESFLKKLLSYEGEAVASRSMPVEFKWHLLAQLPIAKLIRRSYRKESDLYAEISRIAAERDEMLIQKDSSWTLRLEQTANDFEAEIKRISAERDEMLIQKDSSWTLRLEQTANDFEAEIKRISAERDEMLIQKDSSWTLRLEQTANDFEAEIKRISAERDEMLIQKDSSWTLRLEQTANDFEAEIKRISAERDEMLIQKDSSWTLRLEQTANDFEAEIKRISAERDEMLIQKDSSWTLRLEQTANDFEAEIKRISAERDEMLIQKDSSWTLRLEQTANDFEAEIKRISAERDEMLIQKDSSWTLRLEQTANDFEAEIKRISAERDAQKALMSSLAPKVSVITVNFNGRIYLEGLLRSLLQQTFPPSEIIVVDNASSDDSIQFLKHYFPSVRVICSNHNRGFSGGNNLGVEVAKFPLVAFINNDAVVAHDWLEKLIGSWVDRTARGEKLGAICPKIVYYQKFLAFNLQSPAYIANESDSRKLGVAVNFRITKIRDVDYVKPLVLRGFFDEEIWPGGEVVRWTSGDGVLMLPIGDEPYSEPRTLIIQARSNHTPVTLGVRSGDKLIGSYEIGSEFTEISIPLSVEILNGARWVINNAGTRLDAWGNVGDIGINQFDDGQFDNCSVIEAFCGCSFLMQKNIFDDLGGFDEKFFMYYEDSDLSWRLRHLGYKVGFEPSAVVRHIHAGSSGEWSPTFRYYVTRNRHLNCIKNANFGFAILCLLHLFFDFFKCLFRYKHGLSTQDKDLERMSPEQIEFKAITEAILMAPNTLNQRFKYYICRRRIVENRNL